MKATRIVSLALATGMVGALGCAQNVPGSSPSVPPELPSLQTVVSGPIHPDQLQGDSFKTMFNVKDLNIEQIRKQLPSKITAAEASKLLVKIDLNKVVQEGTFETQQWGRFGRGFHGRSFIRRGIYGGFGGLGYGGYGGYGGFGGLGFGGLGCGPGGFFNPAFFGGLGFYPYGGCYFPYAFNAGCYTPLVTPYAGGLCSPFLYGYGGGFYPYTCGW